jgi:hypothetical protein
MMVVTLGLALLTVSSGNAGLQAQARPVTETDWPRVEGDYRISAYPEPFGFLVLDGKLHLKMGGLKGSGRAVPLLARPEGKFVLSEGHPNAFQFTIEGDQVRFTLWSGGSAIPGTREGGGPAAGAAAAPPAAAAPERAVDPRTRADLLRELSEAERAHRRAPSDPAAQLAHGRLLYQAGEFWRARDLLAPLAASPNVADEALELAARLEYLTGRYDAAERLYDRLIEARAGNLSKQVLAKVGKLFVYYQRNRFDRIVELGFPAGVQLPNLALAKAFEQAPYRLEWHADPKVSEVPFYALEPLPQFPIEVNGVPLNMLFDTGGDALILDDEIARALGVTSVATAMGTFGGGLRSPIGFGKVDRVKVGTVTLHQVPIMILAAKRFTFDQRHPIGGVFGTALMRQFLGTIDYRNRKIVLRERTAANAEAVRRDLKDRLAAEIPFVLDATHLMHARGSLDGKEGLTFFIDSGLAMDAAFTAPVQTLQYAGIPVPEPQLQEGGVGGGGGKYPTAAFPIKSISLGPLRHASVRGQYGSRPPASYWERGFIADGLLSHGFLKRYGSWTIDFDSMTYLFEK